MCDDDWTSSEAYWCRLRLLLGQSDENKMPDLLKPDQHTDLWKGLKRWANDTNGKRLGLVQLVEKVGGHRLVAEPRGQCLLRRGDLDQIQPLFSDRRRYGPGTAWGLIRQVLEEEAKGMLPQEYLKPHGRLVLTAPDRSIGAWKQIEAEYNRFIETGSGSAVPPRRDSPTSEARRQPETVARPDPNSPPDVPQREPDTTVLFQLGLRGLSGGLYQGGDERWTLVNEDLADVLHSYSRSLDCDGSVHSHNPQNSRCLLTVRPDEFSAFKERPKCEADADVLLLISEGSEQAWLDDAGDHLFVKKPKCYRSSLGAERPGWVPLAGLPNGWLALRFKTCLDLSGVELKGKWREVVDQHTAKLRAVGGLLLPCRSQKPGAGPTDQEDRANETRDRPSRVWMRGAGPTVQVVGPGSFDHVLIKGKRYPLNDERPGTPDLGLGEHFVRLPDSPKKGLRIRIAEPERAARPDLIGWQRVERGWPASAAERPRLETGSGTLHGAKLAGDWPPVHVPASVSESPLSPAPAQTIPDELAAIRLALALRCGGQSYPLDPQFIATVRTANPLLRGMLRASRSGNFFQVDKA